MSQQLIASPTTPNMSVLPLGGTTILSFNLVNRFTDNPLDSLDEATAVTFTITDSDGVVVSGYDDVPAEWLFNSFIVHLPVGPLQEPPDGPFIPGHYYASIKVNITEDNQPVLGPYHFIVG